MNQTISSPVTEDPMPKFVATAAAVDFETFYSSEYSISDAGLYGYTHDPRFDAYLVSIYAPGCIWVGHPKNAPWDLIKDLEWVSHNQGFDGAVHNRLVELGVIPPIRPKRWHCSANLCVYVGLPRSLKGAVQASYNYTISKDIRDRDIKGKTWSQFGEDLQKRVLNYACDDGYWCLRLWEDNKTKWPDNERCLSEFSYAQGNLGVYVDTEGVDRDIQLLEKVKFEAQQRIPWRETNVILSPKALAEECRKVGIAPPSSLAMGDEDCEAWEEEYGERYPWVSAMRDYRRSNAMLEKFKAIRDRTQPNGRMGYSVLYFGAHTGRGSGSGGFNMKNMPRDPFYFDSNLSIIRNKTKLSAIAKAKKKREPLPGVHCSVDMRSKFIAPPGHKFLIADYEQIEARVTPWLAGDTQTLHLIREGFNVYEAHARQSMGWTGGLLKEENAQLYGLAKARVLGLGFGCGHEKFVILAHTYVDDETHARIFGADVTPEQEMSYLAYREKVINMNAKTDRKWLNWLAAWKMLPRFQQLNLINSWLQVSDFRAKNPKIVALWKRLDLDLRQSVGETLEIELPSGRCLRYFNVNNTENSIQVRTTRGEHFTYTYGGKLCENLVQATARDVFDEAKLRVVDADIPIVMDTYDELVAEVPDDFDGQQLVDLMVVPPKWARGLPIGAELVESRVYLK